MLTLTFDLPMLPVNIILRFYMTLYILDIIHEKHIEYIYIQCSETANLEHRKFPIWPMLNPLQNDSQNMPLKVEYLKN